MSKMLLGLFEEKILFVVLLSWDYFVSFDYWLFNIFYFENKLDGVVNGFELFKLKILTLVVDSY
jgi:hypothetical protein